MGGVAVDDLVKEIGVRGKGLAAGPVGGEVAEEPDPLGGVFGGLELGDEEAEEAVVIGFGAVDEVVGVVDVPKSVFMEMIFSL